MANQQQNINMTIDLEKMTIHQLKQLCRDNKYKGFSLQKKKADLILFIKNKQQENQNEIQEAKVPEEVPETKEVPQEVPETYEPTINFLNYKLDDCKGLIEDLNHDRLCNITFLVNKQKLKRKYSAVLTGRKIKYILSYTYFNPNFINKKNTEIEFTDWCACRANDDGAQRRNIGTYSYSAYKNPLGDCFIIYY